MRTSQNLNWLVFFCYGTRMKLSTFVAILIVIALLINCIQAAAITQKPDGAVDLAMTGARCAGQLLVS